MSIQSSIREDYPDSCYIINARYPSLYSHEERIALRIRSNTKNGGERYLVENPVYTRDPKCKDFYLDHRQNALMFAGEDQVSSIIVLLLFI